MVDHLVEVLVIPDLDLLDFMGGAEAVEEVEERHAALDGGAVGDGRQVHDLLDAAFAEHGKTGLAAGVNVGVVAEDVQSMGSDAARGNIDDARQQLASHFVHIRDHEQQALGSGKRGGQRAGGQRAVNRTGRAGFGLHFDNLDFIAEDIFAALRGPLVRNLSHHRRRRDRIDRGQIGERIRYVRRGVVSIHGFHFSCHVLSSSYTRLTMPNI